MRTIWALCAALFAQMLTILTPCGKRSPKHPKFVVFANHSLHLRPLVGRRVKSNGALGSKKHQERQYVKCRKICYTSPDFLNLTIPMSDDMIATDSLAMPPTVKT